MSIVKTIIHYTWCLPQTLLGLLLSVFRCKNLIIDNDTILVGVKWSKNGVFSLGRFIFYPDWYNLVGNEFTRKHEQGHSKQSLILGPLYLIVIAIPGVIWYTWYYKLKHQKHSYYSCYTESWANKLAGIKVE